MRLGPGEDWLGLRLLAVRLGPGEDWLGLAGSAREERDVRLAGVRIGRHSGARQERA